MVTFPHCETNITLACQNRCVSCNHFIPVQDPWFVKPADFERDMNMAAKVMHFQAYNPLGGEPTLHPQLMDLLDILIGSGITNEIEMTSNGQGYKRLPDAFFQKVDCLEITPYKLTEEDRAYITRKCEDNGTHLKWHNLVFTYAAQKENHSQEYLRAIWDRCWYRRFRVVIDDGYFHRCCIGRFTPSLLMGVDKNHDAIALDGLTESALMDYMTTTEIPVGCFRCNANNYGAVFPWREQPDRAEWWKESLG